MAGVSQVLDALVTTAAAAVYPNGTAQPSVSTRGVRVFPGWPLPNQIDRDLAAGVTNVSVYPTDTERVTTRYPQDWHQLSVSSPTLTLTVSGSTVTVGGTVSTPQNAALLVNGKGYVRALSAGDNLASVATGLATLVNADTSASSSGPVISIPGATELVARVGVAGTSIRELKRQERTFQLSVWSPSHEDRETVADAVEVALAKLDFLTLADGSAGRCVYASSPMTDDFSRAGTYRKDLNYSVDFPTTETRTDAAVLVEDITVRSASSNAEIVAFVV